MKILIVANYNRGYFSPFVEEQIESLRQVGCEVDCYGIVGKGIIGYLSNLSALRKKIKAYRPDFIHAHYGLSGLLANLQRMVPVVTTYHGSDIHSLGLNLKLSRLCMRLSAFNLFVSQALYETSRYGKMNYAILPCGVNTDLFITPDSWEKGRNASSHAGYEVLFAGAFDNEIKNSALAREAVALVDNATIHELKGYSRSEVAQRMQQADVLLMTSKREGSPQVIKEALACGCPIVSVDVGDVKSLIQGVEGCYIAAATPTDIASKLELALRFAQRTAGREVIFRQGLSLHQVAQRLITLYPTVTHEKK